ncbi:hypothetical protein [Mesorhizobium sp.]|uniref:hypothetical protein n=1 Tax=Mesorhizobium sp. TaxID=1871066 RepID=UPI000FE6491D|nr:hypothetical protein [Mesorhizobium sp.]RWO54612.1 MAG: hypothetical protein EOS13_05335 [Mesorhizobium sp.]TIN27648.1 MAG: hypothetical protein E5Y19_10215 [Mesorhizobium sp.]
MGNLDEANMPAVTSSLVRHDHRAIVIFAFLWVGGLVWIGVNTLLNRQDAGTVIYSSTEYRCIAAVTGKKVRVLWSTLKNLRDPSTGFTVGTIIEKSGMNCISDGDAVSYAMLPLSGGTSLSAIRIKGEEVKAEFRQPGLWADITDATGTERWRNDGNGYRMISP